MGRKTITFHKFFGAVFFCLAVISTAVSCTSTDITAQRSTTAGHGSMPEITVVSGYVISVKDTNPPGRYDAPRRFIIAIETEDGSRVNVSYTAYPPSPFRDREVNIRLHFHAGTIREGDYVKARGTYRREQNILEVSGAGDFIETYPEKP